MGNQFITVVFRCNFLPLPIFSSCFITLPLPLTTRVRAHTQTHLNESFFCCHFPLAVFLWKIRHDVLSHVLGMYQYECPLKSYQSWISCDFRVWLENGGILILPYWFRIQHFTETWNLYIIPFFIVWDFCHKSWVSEGSSPLQGLVMKINWILASLL